MVFHTSISFSSFPGHCSCEHYDITTYVWGTSAPVSLVPDPRRHKECKLATPSTVVSPDTLGARIKAASLEHSKETWSRSSIQSGSDLSTSTFQQYPLTSFEARTLDSNKRTLSPLLTLLVLKFDTYKYKQYVRSGAEPSALGLCTVHGCSPDAQLAMRLHHPELCIHYSCPKPVVFTSIRYFWNAPGPAVKDPFAETFTPQMMFDLYISRYPVIWNSFRKFHNQINIPLAVQERRRSVFTLFNSIFYYLDKNRIALEVAYEPLARKNILASPPCRVVLYVTAIMALTMIKLPITFLWFLKITITNSLVILDSSGRTLTTTKIRSQLTTISLKSRIYNTCTNFSRRMLTGSFLTLSIKSLYPTIKLWNYWNAIDSLVSAKHTHARCGLINPRDWL